MKRKIILKKVFHRDLWRIAIFFDYDEGIRRIVRSIPGVKFSGTHRCFYVDDSEENLKLVLRSLKELSDYEIELPLKNEIRKNPSGSEKEEPDKDVQNCSHLDQGWEPLEPQKTIRVIENGEDTEGSFPDHHSYRSGKPARVEFRINEEEGLLVIRFLGRYDAAWIGEMKTYGRCYYDKNRREWSLQWSKLTCDSLADYFTSNGVQISIKKKVVDSDLATARKEEGDEIRSRDLSAKALDGLDSLAMYLDDNRYSKRTRESYLSMLEFFFRYFSGRDPEEITEEEISRFIYDFVIRLGYSAAYQNQIVSAIKTYYTISGKGKLKPEILERPRRSRALPKVFSKEEVSRILNSGRNLKHKVLLWMIYSCGLRRSEVTNIRLDDLDRNRNILFIREGKGKVDRIVPVSQKVWEKIDEYLDAFGPREYLFEGQAGGRYSSESVYRVFKSALLRAGIKKDVGVHSLRHSYATHLHENGLDIRYIQELLGHKSTRTTEIYTHVSRRNLIQVRSPIEDLDLK
jgi:site-specific recombinase XerD